MQTKTPRYIALFTSQSKHLTSSFKPSEFDSNHAGIWTRSSLVVAKNYTEKVKVKVSPVMQVLNQL